MRLRTFFSTVEVARSARLVGEKNSMAVKVKLLWSGRPEKRESGNSEATGDVHGTAIVGQKTIAKANDSAQKIKGDFPDEVDGFRAYSLDGFC